LSDGGGLTRYPLCWPAGWRRSISRTRAQFNDGRMATEPGQGWARLREVSITVGTQRVLKQLKLFRVAESDVLISSDVQLRADGFPRGDRGVPRDPGVAVYWKRGKETQRCMAIDRYDRVGDNLAAIAATLEALRAIERHGGGMIIDRAFTGFKALAAPEQWWTILGVKSDATLEQIETAFRRKASAAHPDKPGGSSGEMSRLNWAREEGLSHVRALLE
jgi:hypothetical protein